MKNLSSLFWKSLLFIGVMPGVLCAARAASAESSLMSTSQPIVVTARKWSEPLQAVPGAVTVQTADQLASAGAQDLRDAAPYVPNLTLGDFTVRRLTFPFMRGIGSGRNSPAVTTCIDGVPQLSYATANQELLDVERIEFLRGAQGALYGRNTLGGVISIVPRWPTNEPSGQLTLSGGDHGLFDVRASAGGSLGQGAPAASLSGGYSTRDGFTKNDVTGNDIDKRESVFGRGQIVWPDQGPWLMSLSLTAERDRDGDYALGDLEALRARPYHVAHDYEGSTERDLAQPVFTLVGHGGAVELTSVTALQWWRAHDRTDLDASPLDLLRRDNLEEQTAWIEELRLSSPEDRPVALCDAVAMRWLAGIFAFRSDYRQRAFTDYRPAAVPMMGLPFPYQQHEDAELGDTGVSLFGQTTFVFADRLELGLGLRHDYEHRSADLRSYADPLFMPATSSADSRDFNQTSPRATLGYHLTPDVLAYVETAKGYKSGGFNALNIPGHTSYDDETSWTYEAGVKTAWLRNRVIANVAVFRTDWDNLQMDIPTGAPGVFYLDNAGKARSQGGELELTLRPLTGLDLFGGVGLLHSQLRPGSSTGGLDVSGNDLPFAPRTTWHAGAEYTQSLWRGLIGFVRLEGLGTGRYYYDAFNGASQGSYTLCNTRLGVTTGVWRLEGWIRNMFDEDYVPLAFPSSLAPSGYVGEMGAPRTVGMSLTRFF